MAVKNAQKKTLRLKHIFDNSEKKKQTFRNILKNYLTQNLRRFCSDILESIESSVQRQGRAQTHTHTHTYIHSQGPSLENGSVREEKGVGRVET